MNVLLFMGVSVPLDIWHVSVAVPHRCHLLISSSMSEIESTNIEARLGAFIMDSEKVSPPPSYTRSTVVLSNESDDVRPPVYTYPATFSIGSKQTTSPLVNSKQLKAHLALLHAFAALKSRVEESRDGRLASMLAGADKEHRWGCFVGLAVER